jgi:hypothetical protein
VVGTIGFDNLVVFRTKDDKGLQTGDLIEHDSAVYVVDESVIRYVPSMGILDKLRIGREIRKLSNIEFISFNVGPPILDVDVPILLGNLRYRNDRC